MVRGFLRPGILKSIIFFLVAVAAYFINQNTNLGYLPLDFGTEQINFVNLVIDILAWYLIAAIISSFFGRRRRW